MPHNFSSPRGQRSRSEHQRQAAARNHRHSSSTRNGSRESQQQQGDAEKGDDGPPAPVGFWDSRLRKVRSRAFLKWIETTAILMIFILAVLSMYWAVLFHIPANLHNLTIHVVDFDQPSNGVAPLVGPIITRMAAEEASRPGSLGYVSVSPAEFNNDPLQVRQGVYDWRSWAAIVINPNATELLYSAIQTGNSSYDPMGACQLIYQSARQETNWQTYIQPSVAQLMTNAVSMVGQEWTRMVLQNASTDAAVRANIQNVPQALSPAIAFSQYDIRPFAPSVALPAVSIGLIYLIILSFFSFPFYLPIHMQYLSPKDHPPLKFYQLVIWRWLATISAYFMLSLAYSFVSLAFQINFSNSPSPGHNFSPTEIPSMEMGNAVAYGRGSFPVYWMVNFFGMIALGLACENVAMVVGQPWTGLWLIFWVITNVCSSFYSIPLSPGFFKWGYAWPLHHVVEASRQVLFDLHSNLGLNFGVLIVWGAIGTILFPLCCWFMRWKTQHNVHEYWPMGN